jgi:hypothetical protein
MPASSLAARHRGQSLRAQRSEWLSRNPTEFSIRFIQIFAADLRLIFSALGFML